MLLAVLTVYIMGSGMIAGLGLTSLKNAAAESLAYAQTASKLSLAATGNDDGKIAGFLNGERVTVLLLGIDQRPDEIGQDPGRTDFIAVATFDPKNRTAGLLSFPRDLWVTIPSERGWFSDRINTAYRQGEVEKIKGGGPEMARRTLDVNFGIKASNSLVVDFEGFTKVVDMMGGVYVDVEKPLKDNEYPTEDYGTKRIYFPSGIQRLTGDEALEYARSRHQDNDFARNKRQQQVLLSVRQRALQLDLLPRLPSILAETRQLFRTDLSPTQILSLARGASGVKTEDITIRAVDTKSVQAGTGAGAILLPDYSAIRQIVVEVFGDPRVRREDAMVVLVSDRLHRAEASRIASALTFRGITVTVDERTNIDYPLATRMLSSGKKPLTTQTVADLFRMDQSKMEKGEPFIGDIEITLGEDLYQAQNR